MKRPIIEFKPKLPPLSQSEKKVIKLLLEAGRLIVPLYQAQENERYAGANFYPHGISKAEIEEASKDNLEILSPYTVVEKKDGKLIATPYHIKYSSLLEKVASKLMQASKLTENKEFSKGLSLQAEVLLTGEYEKAEVYWRSMKPYIIDIAIGPLKRYDDKLLFTKTAYQAWIGILDKEETNLLSRYKDAILTARRKALDPRLRIDLQGRVKVRVDDVLLVSGLAARSKLVGVFMPDSIEGLEKYGCNITLFKQINDDRVQNEILPAFNKFFSTSFKKAFTKADLKKGSLDLIFLHEMGHTYLTYRSADKNLQEFYPVISQLASSMVGIKVAGSLLLKDMITAKELESIMISVISRGIYLSVKPMNPFSPYFVIIGKVLINYLIKTGALQVSKGLVVSNFMKIYVSLNELADTLEGFLANGSRKEVEVFINKYSKSPLI